MGRVQLAFCCFLTFCLHFTRQRCFLFVVYLCFGCSFCLIILSLGIRWRWGWDFVCTSRLQWAWSFRLMAAAAISLWLGCNFAFMLFSFPLIPVYSLYNDLFLSLQTWVTCLSFLSVAMLRFEDYMKQNDGFGWKVLRGKSAIALPIAIRLHFTSFCLLFSFVSWIIMIMVIQFR